MLKEEIIKSNYSIFDYANILLGGFDNILTLIQLNPAFVNMDVALSGFSTKQLVYDDSYYQDKTIQIQLTIEKPKSTTQNIQSFNGQNLYDVVLMSYCELDKMIKFCIDNKINSTNDQDVGSRLFIFDTNLNNNLSFKTIINKKAYVFATGDFGASVPGFYLLKEDGFYLLKEDGFKIIL